MFTYRRSSKLSTYLAFKINVKLIECKQWELLQTSFVRSHEQTVLLSGKLSRITWAHSLML